MKLKFKIIGKDDTKVSIEVRIETKKHILTRTEALDVKATLQNEMHAVLRTHGYSITQIRISK